MELQRRLETLQAQLSDAQRDHTNKYSTADTSLTYTDRQTRWARLQLTACS